MQQQFKLLSNPLTMSYPNLSQTRPHQTDPLLYGESCDDLYREPYHPPLYASVQTVVADMLSSRCLLN